MIRKTLALCVLAAVLFLATGCENPGGKSAAVGSQVKNSGRFPQFLVGTWKPQPEDNNRWVFTFQQDGSISKFRHFVGMEFVVAEGGLIEPWRGDAEAVFGLGPCTAEYNPESRILTVTIVIENYIITFPNGTMEGRFSDSLTGPVSQDGLTWQAEWTSKSEIFGGGSGETTMPLVFTKIDEDTNKQDESELSK